MRVIVVGAGGHGQVICDALIAAAAAGAPAAVAGFVDDRSDLRGSSVLGLPILGRIAELGDLEHDAIVIAVGSNRRRQELFETLAGKGERFCTVIHPRAVIAARVAIGAGTMIVAGAIVNTGSTIGANAILNTGCSVDHHNTVGDHVHIAPGVHLGGEVRVGEGALVGIGATVLPGKAVGAWAIVAGGAVVTQDVLPATTVVGTPARPLRSHSLPRS